MNTNPLAAAPAATPAGATVPAGAEPADAAQAGPERWRDPSAPVAERVCDLLSRMTLEEKLGQLGSAWLSEPGDGTGRAPMQGEFTDGLPPFTEMIRHGLGQLTRVFGTRPVEPEDGTAQLARLQAQVMAQSRFGIPAIAHEECLTGLAAWKATAFPVPLAWGASFDAETVTLMAAAIGASMRAAGIHQGLAPVLDVARDPRWGRVEETISADPYLVGVLGTAYVQGLESSGVIATLKHFAGYSASRGARNMAPVSIGWRELADVFLSPFEMALREGGARSVMHSYTDNDGVPAAADQALLTGILRDELGFDGVLVADYYGVSLLEAMHRVAGSRGQAAGLALRAGVDVELPNTRCFGAPLAQAVASGQVPVGLVDRAAARVLRQKAELGLLDSAGAVDSKNEADGAEAARPPGAAGGPADFDPPVQRDLARRLAEHSAVLLANGAGALPLADGGRIAVVGPLAGDPLAGFGSYTFPRHVLVSHPETGPGLALTPFLDALRHELPGARVEHERGCGVTDPDRSGFAAALDSARAADTVVAVLGDLAGLFGRGSVGEGSDTCSLRLPGVQADLLAELVATGTPVVAVLITGRPYALGPVADQLAAAVQAFFPGQEGPAAVAGVLSGRVVPSGKLPLEMPRDYDAPPPAYLAPPLAGRSDVSTADPTPLYPFGHGLSYTTFGYSGLSVCAAGPEAGNGAGPAGGGSRVRIGTDGAAEIACTVRNTGSVAGAEVVQLYLHDPVAQVTRPVRALAGFARVTLPPGGACRVVFRLHADRTAFHGLSGKRIVEPGLIELAIGSSSADLRLHGELELTGPERRAGAGRVLTTPVSVTALADG